MTLQNHASSERRRDAALKREIENLEGEIQRLEPANVANLEEGRRVRFSQYSNGRRNNC